MVNRRSLLLAGMCWLLTQGVAPFANAQSTVDPSNGASGEVGEIIVTAQRRSERLQDVPVSISAVAGDEIARQKIATPSDIVAFVPNLQAASTVGEGIPVFSLRGVSMSDYSINQQGPVATYVDEVYRGTFPLLGLDLYDVERVEVLRGPQGTLYGKNTTGGAVNIISKKPGFEAGGYLSAGLGNYGRKEASGAYQLGLSDTTAARLAFTYANANGWFHNESPGEPNPEALRQYGVRGSLLYSASESLNFLLRLSASKQDPINYGIYGRPGANGTGNGVYAAFGGQDYSRSGLGKYDIESNHVLRRLHKTYGVALTSNWNVSDALTLTSITSFDHGKLFIPEDADGSPLQVLEDDIRGTARQFAEDLRLASHRDEGLNYILGAYYNEERMRTGTAFSYYTDVDANSDGAVDAEDCLVNFVFACIYRNRFRQVKKNTAVYADVNTKVSPHVILRGGVRVTHDTGSIPNYTAGVLGADGTPIANTIPGDPHDFAATARASFSKNNVSGKIGIDYKTDRDNLLYASVSRGYRASSFNAQAYFLPTELNVARPELLTAYELGFKSQYLSRTLTVNAALFYYDYKDQQALNVDAATLAQTLVNIPKSRIAGGELELAVRPSSALRITLGVGALDTKIEDGIVSGVRLDGNRLPNAPSLSVTAGVDWDIFRSNAGQLVGSVQVSHSSKQYFELFNVDRIADDGYTLLNAQLSYRSPNDRYGISLWGRNLTDQYYFRSAIDVSGFGFDYFHLGAPRTYGVTLDATL